MNPSKHRNMNDSSCAVKTEYKKHTHTHTHTPKKTPSTTTVNESVIIIIIIDPTENIREKKQKTKEQNVSTFCRFVSSVESFARPCTVTDIQSGFRLLKRPF